MPESRLSLALDAGAIHLPATGTIAVYGPRSDMDLSVLPRDRVRIVQGFRPDHDAWQARGYATDPEDPGEDIAAAILCLPRARAAAQALVARAVADGGPVIVDGQKTDGIDSLIKAMRPRAEVSTPFAKAHGKVAQISAAPAAFADWALPRLMRQPSGWTTAPGLFSADGPDPASVALGRALPEKMPGRVADLGAGWGYLSFQVLERRGVTECLAVEAEHTALDAARANVNDDRVRFHWADARNFSDPKPLDHIVTNPPFHTDRRAQPALGAAFIAASARLLGSRGTLWLVANRHLPYEAPLSEHFGEVRPLSGPPGFKLYAATRPRKPRR